jgi:hypothetical protein
VSASETPAADKAKLFPILTFPRETSLFICEGSQLISLKVDRRHVNGNFHWECSVCGLIGNTNNFVHKPRLTEDPKPVELPPMPCARCEITGDHVTFAADPYESDLRGDHTRVWMCSTCRSESADEL